MDRDAAIRSVVEDMLSRPAAAQGLTKLADIARQIDENDEDLGVEGTETEMQDDLRGWECRLRAALEEKPAALTICGGSESVVCFAVGCGKPIYALDDLYRCASCDVPMHQDCLKRHFGPGDGPPPTRVEQLAMQLREEVDAKIDRLREDVVWLIGAYDRAPAGWRRDAPLNVIDAMVRLREDSHCTDSPGETCADPACPVHGESEHNLMTEGEVEQEEESRRSGDDLNLSP